MKTKKSEIELPRELRTLYCKFCGSPLMQASPIQVRYDIDTGKPNKYLVRMSCTSGEVSHVFVRSLVLFISPKGNPTEWFFENQVSVADIAHAFNKIDRR